MLLTHERRTVGRKRERTSFFVVVGGGGEAVWSPRVSRWSAADLARHQAQHLRPVSKYHAVRTMVDGVTFASKAEAQRYHELKLLQKAGQIQDLILQPRYALHVREVIIGHYVADFAYRTGKLLELVVEDVKGVRTALYLWKRKHMQAEYGIVVQEIR